MAIHNTPPIFRPPNRASHFKSNNIANRYKVNSTRHYGDELLFRERVMNRTALHRIFIAVKNFFFESILSLKVYCNLNSLEIISYERIIFMML